MAQRDEFTLDLFGISYRETKRKLQLADETYAQVHSVTSAFIADETFLSVIDQWRKEKSFEWWADKNEKSCYWWWSCINQEARNPRIATLLSEVPDSMVYISPAIYQHALRSLSGS